MAADANLGTVLANSIPKAEALAFMIAVTFNIPCLMAVTSTYEESHSFKMDSNYRNLLCNHSVNSFFNSLSCSKYIYVK